MATPWRTLPEAVILQNHGGEYLLELEDGRVYEASPGQGFVVPPGQHHQIRVPTGGALVSRYLHLEIRVNGVLDAFQILRLPFVLPAATAREVGRVAVGATALRTKPSSLLLKRAVEEQLLALKAAAVLFELAEIVDLPAERPEYLRLAPLIEWMSRNLSAPQQRCDLASAAGVSEQHLNDLFQEAVGVPPMRFLGELRVSHARKLLLESGLSVAEIAEHCGYSSPEYFSRAFLQQTGHRPSAFRKLRRES